MLHLGLVLHTQHYAVCFSDTTHYRLERHIIGSIHPSFLVSYVDRYCQRRIPFFQTVQVNRDARALEQQAERIKEYEAKFSSIGFDGSVIFSVGREANEMAALYF